MAKRRDTLHWPCAPEQVVEATIMAPGRDPDIIRGMQDVKDVVVLRAGWVAGGYALDLDIESDADVPQAVKNLLGGRKIGWLQKGLYEPDKGLYTVRVTPHLFANNIRVTTLAAITPNASGTQMVLDFEAKCDIPLLGRIIESLIVQKVAASLVKQYHEDIRRIKAGAG